MEENKGFYPDAQPGYVTTQPTSGGVSHHTNVVIVQQDANKNYGAWTTSLFGCFEDMGSCLAATFCTPFYTCYLANKMGEHCCMPLCIAPPADLVVLRMKLRTMRNIPGGAISDCCAATWCTCCTAAQMSREWENSAMQRQ
ncbi:cornifelin homolog B-like [Glandiceps talaboti]